MGKISVKELYEAKLARHKAELMANQDIMIFQLKEILKHQKETNGKVKVIYTETSFSRWCQRNYKTAIILFVLAVILISIFHGEIIQVLINKI